MQKLTVPLLVALVVFQFVALVCLVFDGRNESARNERRFRTIEDEIQATKQAKSIMADISRGLSDVRDHQQRIWGDGINDRPLYMALRDRAGHVVGYVTAPRPTAPSARSRIANSAHWRKSSRSN